MTFRGNVGGDILIHGNMSGDITITKDQTGDLMIDEDLSGSITVGWALANGGVGGGRILVSGESSGAIKVGKRTGSLTLIHAAGVLATGATIEINTTQGNFNADGDIHIGSSSVCPALPPDITFDGCIRIYDHITSGAGGSLKGAITICGCHELPVPPEPNDLNICIDGNDNDNVTISQMDCHNQVGWSCNTCP